MAGRPALSGGEPGQVRKEAATATRDKCRGSGSPPSFSVISMRLRAWHQDRAAPRTIGRGAGRKQCITSVHHSVHQFDSLDFTMSYQVLARKWRPRNFSELAG